MRREDFNWGNSSEFFIASIGNEIFDLNCYECIYPVQEGDVVVDIGASVGPFSFTVQEKVKKLYALEPLNDAADTLQLNSVGFPVEVIRAAIGNINGELAFNGECHTANFYGDSGIDREFSVPSITFLTFVNQYNLETIDFLKIDCEGGEYQIFRDENINYLINKVRNIVCEFHLEDKEGKARFRHFRDVYLEKFKSYTVIAMDGVDITWDLFNDSFLEYYTEVVIHISNK